MTMKNPDSPTLAATDTFLGFDLETTGIDIATARILTSSLVWFARGSFRPLTNIVNPGVPVPPESTAIHGMTDEYIQENGGDPVTTIAQVRQHIDEAWNNGTPLVGHNISYDLGVLNEELKRYSMEPLRVFGPVLDTMVMHRMCGNRKASLAVTAEAYGVVNESAHSSEADTIATLKILNGMKQRPSLANKTLRDLYREQQSFHYLWAQDLQSYFHRIGKYDQVNGQWPVQDPS